jgi:hypothetical protein
MRLLDWPIGLGFTSIELISGPRPRGEATETVGGFVQSSASPFGMAEYKLTLPPIRDAQARAYRGLISAMHGGANPVRITLPDPDRERLDELGMPVSQLPALPWGNGLNWGNGLPWQTSLPVVSVAASSPVQSSIVYLADEHWGHRLGMGSQFGFIGHFGVYEVTEVVGAGAYRVWPLLRKAVNTSTIATLKPTIVLRLKSRNDANRFRDVALMENLSLNMVEVADYYVREALA